MKRTKMPNRRNGSKGDSNPGSLDCESDTLPFDTSWFDALYQKRVIIRALCFLRIVQHMHSHGRHLEDTRWRRIAAAVQNILTNVVSFNCNDFFTPAIARPRTTQDTSPAAHFHLVSPIPQLCPLRVVPLPLSKSCSTGDSTCSRFPSPSYFCSKQVCQRS